MAKVKLELDTPFEGALQFAKGKYYPSTKIPGNPGSTMYSLESGDVMFLEHTVCDEPDQLFVNAKVGAHEAFTITLRKRSGQRYYEVHAATPTNSGCAAAQTRQQNISTPEPPSKLESQLQASIDHVNAQRAAAIPQGQTKASFVMGAALIASMDAWRIAQAYAERNGFVLGPPSPEDLRAMAATLYIQACKNDPLFNDRAPAPQRTVYPQ